MIKLKSIINKLKNGEKIKEVNLSLYDIKELIRIYNELISNKRALFSNGNCKILLEKYNINIKVYGIGWKAYL